MDKAMREGGGCGGESGGVDKAGGGGNGAGSRQSDDRQDEAAADERGGRPMITEDIPSDSGLKKTAGQGLQRALLQQPH